MIRYGFGALLILVTAAAACGSFGADDTPTGQNVTDAGSSGSSGSEDAAALDTGAPVQIDTDANGVITCIHHHFEDDFEADGGALGWTRPVTAGGAGVAVGNVQGTGHVLTASLADGPDQRAYLELAHPGSPCGPFTYQATFRAKATPEKVDHRIAGPRLGGIFSDLDPGSDGFRNQIAVGVAFFNDKVELSYTDDACAQLLPNPCITPKDLHPVVNFPLGNGWHDYELTITTRPDVSKENGYGTITLRVDGTASINAILPYPLEKMRLATYFGISLSRDKFKGQLSLDNAKIDLAPL